MNKKTILITGACGEVGHGLIKELGSKVNIIALDIAEPDLMLTKKVLEFYRVDILNKPFLKTIFNKHKIDTVFHLAALLSTSAERTPELAHKVNVQGSLNLLDSAHQSGVKDKHAIKFIFPSSIAVYGLKDIKTKKETGKVKEEDFNSPITMYGINKLYVENLGSYFSTNYRLLVNSFRPIDFRCVRFPGLISSETTPTGGTSDYAPEMVHFAAQGKAYDCFVRPDSTIPFMAMPDAVSALTKLANTPRKNLSKLIYNVSGFSTSADTIRKQVMKAFPKAKIDYKVDFNRQKIVDSWPQDVDDSGARRDWGWKPNYDFKTTFEDYLILNIKRNLNSLTL